MLALRIPKRLHAKEKCVFKHTGKARDDTNGNATIATQLENKNKRIELRIERRPRIYVLSTNDSEENRMATNKENNSECDIVALRKDTFCTRERKGPSLASLQWESKNDRNPNAPTCVDLHQPWTHHCEEESQIAAWKLHKSIYNIRGTYQENKETFLKSQTVTGLIFSGWHQSGRKINYV